MYSTMSDYFADLSNRLQKSKYIMLIVFSNGEESLVDVSSDSVTLQDVNEAGTPMLSRDDVHKALDYMNKMFDEDEYECDIIRLGNFILY